MTQTTRGVTEESRDMTKTSPRTVPYRSVPCSTDPTTSPSAVPSNSGTHSPSLGGAGGKVGRRSEYDGIWLNPEEWTSDMVPVRAWHRLKHFIDEAGQRMAFEADYRATAEKLRETYGFPLRGGKAETAGFEQEVWLFKRWHLRVHGVEPSRWPWQPIPEAA